MAILEFLERSSDCCDKPKRCHSQAWPVTERDCGQSPSGGNGGWRRVPAVHDRGTRAPRARPGVGFDKPQTSATPSFAWILVLPSPELGETRQAKHLSSLTYTQLLRPRAKEDVVCTLTAAQAMFAAANSNQLSVSVESILFIPLAGLDLFLGSLMTIAFGVVNPARGRSDPD